MPRPSLVQCASPGDGERRTACKALSSPQGHPADTGLASLFFRTRRFHCVAARNAALSSTARKARAERSCNQPQCRRQEQLRADAADGMCFLVIKQLPGTHKARCNRRPASSEFAFAIVSTNRLEARRSGPNEFCSKILSLVVP